MKHLQKNDPWGRINPELTKELLAIPDKPIYTEEEERHDVLLKILEVMDNKLRPNEIGKFSAEQLLNSLKGYGISSKRDLAIRLSTVGITNRVLLNNGKYGRYYCVSKEMIASARNKLSEGSAYEEPKRE